MQPQDFFNTLKENELISFYGVPDSLLKNICAYITDNVDEKHNIITANEGNAIAFACGHYLATSKPAVVYMQNSGLGNCVNPLLSLSDEEVYNIPFLMIIGWRGEPGIKDEPQHIKQGKVTTDLLEAMGVDFCILPTDINKAKEVIEFARNYMQETKKPYALLVQKDSFDNYKLQTKKQACSDLSREDAICLVAKELKASDVVVATTGHISRELYEFRENNNQAHSTDFLCVGSMGHASSIAAAIAIEKPNKNVFCFDGDGACLMHMGAMPIIAAQNLSNLKHIVFNNEAHDSVGGQPTCSGFMSVTKIALASGYKKAYSVSTAEEISSVLPEFLSAKETALLEIKVKCGARSDLGRPKEKPYENKEMFMKNLSEV